jgi:hypothetical protein
MAGNTLDLVEFSVRAASGPATRGVTGGIVEFRFIDLRTELGQRVTVDVRGVRPDGRTMEPDALLLAAAARVLRRTAALAARTSVQALGNVAREGQSRADQRTMQAKEG